MNKFKKIILNNGIPLYLCVDPSMKRTYVSYNVNYGSSGEWFNFNNEGKDFSVISGYAHYIEHLLGEHGKYGCMYNNFDQRFQRANAFTAMNLTSYHFNGRDEIEKSIKELIETIDTPVFDDKDVDATRHAIEEESSSFVDDTDYVLTGLIERNLYGGFDLFDETYSPIGNRETTKQITTQELYDCYNAFYSDDKKFIVIAGNVEEERIVDLLNNIYTNIKPHKSSLVLPELDYDSIRSRDEIIHGDLDIPKVGLGIKFEKDPSVSANELYYAAYIVRNSLNDSNEMRALKNDKLYDVFVSSYFNNVNDNLDFLMGFVSNEKEKLVDSLLEILSKKDISKEEYELAKKSIIAAEQRSMDSKYGYLKNIPEIINRTDGQSVIDLYQSIDYDRFQEVLSTLDFDNYTVGEIKRLSKKVSD